MTTMTKPLAYDDLCLTCVQCDSPFNFPATEQDFFVKRNLAPPKRCRKCRNQKQNYGNESIARQLPKKSSLPNFSDVGESESTKIVELLKTENRKLWLEIQDMRMELKEIQLYIRSRKVAKMEKALKQPS
jgi:hypothetical protein